MIWIVTGYMRTGTSMMMQALVAGGMDAAWSKERDQLADSQADGLYHPNAGGLYEVPLREYGQPGFPLQYQDKLIKVMTWGLEGLEVHQYRVIVMRRDPEEIRQSYEGFFDRPLKDKFMNRYAENMRRIVQRLGNRRDVRGVVELDYRSVVDEPLDAFKTVAASGWPIDPIKAAEVVDPAQCRFRRELLTVGI